MASVQHTPEVALVKEEEKAVGVVAFSVYRGYWSSVGHLLAPFILFALFLMQGMFTGGVPIMSSNAAGMIIKDNFLHQNLNGGVDIPCSL